MVIGCMRCGKPVSSEVPDATIIRAWIECPECIESRIAEGPPADIFAKMAAALRAGVRAVLRKDPRR